MSQLDASPNTKTQTKPSLKKSSISPPIKDKADQSKSKKKHIEVNGQLKNASSVKKNSVAEDKIQPKIQSKSSSKKAALQFKSQSQFKEKVFEAEKSEKSAKIMKSTDKITAIKENHNNIESNVRQFSHSRQNDDQLELSKKKINTESKKSKIVDSGSKHSKTEEKVVTVSQIKQQKYQDAIIKEKEALQQVEQKTDKTKAQPVNIGQENQIKNTKEEVRESNVKDIKRSKNLKRPQVSKSIKDAEENLQSMKKSKSVKQSQSKSQAKSKDSKIGQQKSGIKKTKQNQRWH